MEMSADRLFHEALDHHRAGRIGEARRLYAEVLRLRPDDVGALHYSGVTAFLSGDLVVAEVSIRRALDLSPGNVAARNDLGNVLVSMGRLEEAAAAFGRVIAVDPTDAKAHVNLGVVLAMQEDFASALGHFETAAARPGAPPAVHCFLADARANLGLIQEAISGLSRVLKDFPDIPGGNELLRRLLHEPYFPASALQGFHAPERQVYMAAAVYAKRALGRPIRILEIGSYMGASLFTWVSAISRFTTEGAEITCVDPWEGAAGGEYTAGMRENLRTGRARRIFTNNARHLDFRISLRPIVGTSDEVLSTLGTKFDIIYIDGCHMYASVRQDILSCHRLIEDGGYICGDDLEVQLPEVDPDVVKDGIGNHAITDARVGTFYHPGVTLAVGEIFGTVSAYRGFWIMERQGEAYRPVSLAGMRGCLPRHWPESMHQGIRENIAADGVLCGID
jgi:Tfp pilus assembly protein PilF